MSDVSDPNEPAPSRFAFVLTLDGDSHVAGATPDATQDSAIDDAQTLLETAIDVVGCPTAACAVMDGAVLVGTWRWADSALSWTRRG